MRTQTAAGLCVTVVAAGMLLAPSGAAARTAAPTASFDISDATTYTRGVVTWNDRSVTVTGEHSSPSADDCRATWVYTFDIARNRLGSKGMGFVCDRTTTYDFTVPADTDGGADLVTVCLDDHDLNDLKCDSFSKP
ncbi:hypothetical protein AB0M05_27785 [Streptomyces violaceusniger]|uniref:hypothetical protein n=1 Tax=Streptomyces violaceusniger TaxID=68280 RepID=UPI00341EEDB7